jgi:hypothetical protein
VAALPGAAVASSSIDPSFTNLVPVVQTIGAYAATSRCRAHLVLLSDGQTGDIALAATRAPLAAAQVDEVSLLMPTRRMRAPADFRQAFPYATPHSFDGADPDATALAIAEAVARSTGQDVRRAD